LEYSKIWREGTVAGWEYLVFSTYRPNSLTVKDRMSISTAHRVDLEWLSQSYPSTRVKSDKRIPSLLVDIYPKHEEWEQVYWAIMDHLGSEGGWEAFALPETEYGGDKELALLLKRPL
jgi:hypothetical protein